MDRVLIQAGHSSALPPYYPNPGGGAPGEAAWTADLAQRVAARLSTRGVGVVLVGHWLDSSRNTVLPAPAEALADYDLCCSLHYDGSLNPNATGCCAGRATNDPMGAAADAFLGLWTAIYPAALDIPLDQTRVGVNITDYYAFRDTSENTPGILLEHGYGNCADHDILFGAIDLVADADATAILAYLHSLRHPIWGNTKAPRTQAFGVNPDDYTRFGLAGHNGVDFGTSLGTALYAPEAGVVIEAYFDADGYGNTVYLLGSSGRGWRLGHLDSLAVAEGQHVERGDYLGASGSTGNSTGPHLHVGVRTPAPDYGNGFNGYVDPSAALDEVRAAPPTTDSQEEQAEMERIAELEAALAALQADRDFNFRLKMQFEARLREPLYHRRVSASGKTVRYVGVTEYEIQAAVAAARGS